MRLTARLRHNYAGTTLREHLGCGIRRYAASAIGTAWPWREGRSGASVGRSVDPTPLYESKWISTRGVMMCNWGIAVAGMGSLGLCLALKADSSWFQLVGLFLTSFAIYFYVIRV
ncbi:hypothetical protein [Cupriavidus consociatus]|uniref:hypothetical protein n=1 Tax=Cupriavidus consociatus TaxID=2821357 RepID=UPI001AE567CC|nr:MULTISPECIES: hypothetical protein [unclassified Cupriavidus]MBP0625296.1 hypothetical protein [Cupriavidus sp. LEh25]MDK2662029.1 hypothetical protein [Cupriavidus sp. LEh21]